MQSTRQAVAEPAHLNLQRLDTLRREGVPHEWRRVTHAWSRQGCRSRLCCGVWNGPAGGAANEIVAEIAAPGAEEADYLLVEPGVEVAALAAMDKASDQPALWMPVAGDRVTRHAPATAWMWCHIRLQAEAGLSADIAKVHVQLFDIAGAAIASIADSEMQQLDGSHRSSAQMIHTINWQAAPLPADAAALPAAGVPAG